MVQEFIDQKTPQVFILKFLDESEGVNVLASTNGDFTTDPIAINRPFMTGVDFAVGEVPSATLSCTLQNADKRFSGFPFGEAYTFIGYKDTETSVATFTVNGHTIDLADASNDIEIDGSPVGYTRMSTAAVISEVYSYDAYLYCIDDNNDVRKINIEDITDDTTLGGCTDFFKNLIDSHDNRITYIQCAEEYGDPVAFTVWEDGTQTDYFLDPVGVYSIERPRSTSTLTIDITDAFDRARQFDKTCGAFVSDEKATYPSMRCSAADFINDIMTVFGYMYYSTLVAQNTTIRLDWLTEEAYTYRQLLSFAAEACCSNLYANSCGEFDSYYLGAGGSFGQFPDTMIAADSYDRADFMTQRCQEVELYKANNTIFISGGYGPGYNNYVIQNNPVMDENTLQDCQFTDGLYYYPTYHPVTVDLTELDPDIFRAANKTVDIMNIYSGSYETVPIWEVNIYWCGKTYGQIISGGEEYRKRNDFLTGA